MIELWTHVLCVPGSITGLPMLIFLPPAFWGSGFLSSRFCPATQFIDHHLDSNYKTTGPTNILPLPKTKSLSETTIGFRFYYEKCFIKTNSAEHSFACKITNVFVSASRSLLLLYTYDIQLTVKFSYNFLWFPPYTCSRLSMQQKWSNEFPKQTHLTFMQSKQLILYGLICLNINA